ncbi:MAG: dTDP-4-dehydrorhamnose 3,5-epimerase [Candidatus Lokiarchaeota archaeon]|nr:dTDP-4-dehydrorhamnose 3,5-epimerase [Candidatus Lokiarchaeota archaeon]MBD3200814.1 dTDP-4-dehydrorhamnose 3,5-epimerase [Candidatus Lokiarchaeota archaeon]
MIEGIEIKDLKKFVDERGFFTELLREDWSDALRGDNIVQFNLSYSYPGIIRAWHRHLRGQDDYFMCVVGSIKICAYDDREDSDTYGELDEIIISEETLKLVRIPGILWHGYQAIGYKPVKVLYGVTKLYKYGDPDEERRPWDDKTLIPRSINGNLEDERVGKSWDWYHSPNK